MNKKIFGILFIATFLYILSSGLAPVLAEDNNSQYPSDSDINIRDDDTNLKAKVKIKIDEAYYCDADEDNKVDDVVVHFTIDFGVDDWDVISYYKIDVVLQLPSGLTYVNHYYLKVQPSAHSMLYMYNHATESGWYNVGMECTAYLSNGSIITCADKLIFDPPEGIGGTEPLKTKMMI